MTIPIPSSNLLPQAPTELNIRFTMPKDGPFLKEWLMDEEVARYFPMSNEAEVEHATQHWISFCKYHCSLTADWNGEPVGIATLFLQPYKKLMHQSEFGVIVSPKMRGKGIGTMLILYLMELAKKNFHFEMLQLQVYTNNPAIKLYERLGFKTFGKQSHWIKEADGTPTSRTLMERFL